MILMKNIQYFSAKLLSKIKREKYKESIVALFVKQGMRIGKNTNICSNIITTESHLIEIGDYTTISSNVTFITHDNSICKVVKPIW